MDVKSRLLICTEKVYFFNIFLQISTRKSHFCKNIQQPETCKDRLTFLCLIKSWLYALYYSKWEKAGKFLYIIYDKWLRLFLCIGGGGFKIYKLPKNYDIIFEQSLIQTWTPLIISSILNLYVMFLWLTVIIILLLLWRQTTSVTNVDSYTGTVDILYHYHKWYKNCMDLPE